jgi:hypothetical protein
MDWFDPACPNEVIARDLLEEFVDKPSQRPFACCRSPKDERLQQYLRFKATE